MKIHFVDNSQTPIKGSDVTTVIEPTVTMQVSWFCGLGLLLGSAIAMPLPQGADKDKPMLVGWVGLSLKRNDRNVPGISGD
jgi:hypothetical protein